MAASRELNKYLKELSKEDLIMEVIKLNTRFKFVKDYYTSELGTDNGTLLINAKARLKKLILKTGRKITPDIASSNRIIREYGKVSVHAVDTIDLMLYKVELCLEFLDEWGLQFAGVENSVYTTYHEIVQLIYKNKLEQTFATRCKVVEAKGENYGLIGDRLKV